MVSKVYMICNSYESGYGHGLANDGLDLSKTPHADAEQGEAYQIGYEAGQEGRQDHCMCDSCKGGDLHASDCAVHNEPAMRNEQCDCRVAPNVKLRGAEQASLAERPSPTPGSAAT